MTLKSAISKTAADLQQLSRRTMFLLLLCGGVLGYNLAPDEGFAVRFENQSQQMISSIKLDFGSADAQSSMQTFRLGAGESRTLFLNHPPGAGFNVQVLYADGQKQAFCALRGDTRVRPTIPLVPGS